MMIFQNQIWSSNQANTVKWHVPYYIYTWESSEGAEVLFKDLLKEKA